MKKSEKENKQAVAIFNIMQRNLDMKEAAYESVSSWFKKEYNSGVPEDVVNEWETKGKELNSQITLLRNMIEEADQYVI